MVSFDKENMGDRVVVRYQAWYTSYVGGYSACKSKEIMILKIWPAFKLSFRRNHQNKHVLKLNL